MTASAFLKFYNFIVSYNRFHVPKGEFVYLNWFDQIVDKSKLLWKAGFIRIFLLQDWKIILRVAIILRTLSNV